MNIQLFSTAISYEHLSPVITWGIVVSIFGVVVGIFSGNVVGINFVWVEGVIVGIVVGFFSVIVEGILIVVGISIWIVVSR